MNNVFDEDPDNALYQNGFLVPIFHVVDTQEGTFHLLYTYLLEPAAGQMDQLINLPCDTTDLDDGQATFQRNRWDSYNKPVKHIIYQMCVKF